MADNEKNTKVNDDSSKAHAVGFFGGLFIVVFFSFADDWLIAYFSTDPISIERITRAEKGPWLRLSFRVCQIGGVVYMVTAAILEVRQRLRGKSKNDPPASPPDHYPRPMQDGHSG